MCYMETITHREMRNSSAEVLRRVAAGETLQISNNGRPTALLVPVRNPTLDDLIERGQARAARGQPGSGLRSIKRATSTMTTAEIISYDQEFSDAAHAAGLAVFAPGSAIP